MSTRSSIKTALLLLAAAGAVAAQVRSNGATRQAKILAAMGSGAPTPTPTPTPEATPVPGYSLLFDARDMESVFKDTDGLVPVAFDGDLVARWDTIGGSAAPAYTRLVGDIAGLTWKTNVVNAGGEVGRARVIFLIPVAFL